MFRSNNNAYPPPQNLISVIIPLYNNGKYLSKCLESVLNQPFKDIEIIIIDDGSTDNGLEIAEDYAEKFDNISAFHFENGGVSVARNRGLEKATGKYIAFLDPDDTWVQNCLTEKLISALQKDYDVIFCGFHTTDGQNIIKSFFENDKEVLSGGFENAKKYNSHLCSCFFSFKHIKKYFISFEPGRKYAEDYAFIEICAYCAEKILHINNPTLLYWNQNNDSAIHAKMNIFDRLNQSREGRLWPMEQCLSKKSYGEASDKKVKTYYQALADGAVLEMLQCHFLNSCSVRLAIENLKRLKLYDFVINGDKTRLDLKQQQELALFCKHPHIFMLKYRFKGIVSKTLKLLLPRKAINAIIRKYR